MPTFAWLTYAPLWDVLSAVGAWISDKLLGPAIVAVVFSAATSIVLEHRKSKRDLDTRIADELREDIRTLQQLAVSYWGRKREGGDAAVEARIIGLQSEIFESLAVLATEANLQVLSSDQQAEVADLVTGGDFGSRRRAADPARVRQVSARLGEIRTAIARVRWRRLRQSGN